MGGFDPESLRLTDEDLRQFAARKSRSPSRRPTNIWRLPPFEVHALVAQVTEVIDWGLTSLGIPDTWKETSGAGIKVAVLDTGFYPHPDFKDAVVSSQDFTGDGIVDRHGHSTHVCGIVAARRDGQGCVGVAPECSLLVGKVLGDNGSGQSSWIAAGIRWAVDAGADIISMSLGAPHPDPIIRSALREAVSQGRFVLCAAGNEGPYPDSVGFPAAWPEAIAIGAVNRDRRVSRFSSRGKEVCVCAPGEGITSCWHKSLLAVLSGTSMACPYAAGVAALAIARHRKIKSNTPLATQEDLRKHLQQTAVDIDSTGRDPASGWGLVDPRKVLSELGDLQPAPGSPDPAPGIDWLSLILDLLRSILEALGKSQAEVEAVCQELRSRSPLCGLKELSEPRRKKRKGPIS